MVAGIVCLGVKPIAAFGRIGMYPVRPAASSPPKRGLTPPVVRGPGSGVLFPLFQEVTGYVDGG